MAELSVKIAVIGDIHRSWDDSDTEYFNHSDYDIILIVGDLPGRSHMHTTQMARKISKLSKQSLYIPGNHDGVSTLQLLAELQGNPTLIEAASGRQDLRCRRLEKAIGPVQFCGYSLHPVSIRGVTFDIIAGRPHSMGGKNMGYRPYLRRKYGIGTMAQSAARLKELVDQSQAGSILFLAHNGPTGLGRERTDIWGCDFRKKAGDFGDSDLREAVDYAVLRGRNILGVAAGHMHLRLKGGAQRVDTVRKDGILYMNAARVPRIFTNEAGIVQRHHVRLTTNESKAEASHVLVSRTGSSFEEVTVSGSEI